MKNFFLFALAGIFLFSCADNSSNPATEPSELVPLKVGNEWVYNISRMDSAGSVIESYPEITKILTAKIIDGEMWYSIDEYEKIFWRNTVKGFYVWHKDFSEQPWLAAKYPANIGDRFAERFVGYLVDSAKNPQSMKYAFALAAKNISVTVPAGKFSCYMYQRILIIGDKEYPLNEFDYYAPGIGRIKTETLKTQNVPVSERNYNVTEELVSYKLK